MKLVCGVADPYEALVYARRQSSGGCHSEFRSLLRFRVGLGVCSVKVVILASSNSMNSVPGHKGLVSWFFRSGTEPPHSLLPPSAKYKLVCKGLCVGHASSVINH